MNRTRHTVESLARRVGTEANRISNLLRRMVVDRTRGTIWKLVGFDEVAETAEAEAFLGIGFHARPRAGAETQAIVAYPGGPEQPVIVATRDEALRRQVAELDEDETAIFTSTAIVKISKDGSIEIRSTSGAAVPLVPLASLEALRDALVAWTPAPGDGGAALKTLLTALIGPGPVYAWPTGTTVLKGE